MFQRMGTIYKPTSVEKLSLHDKLPGEIFTLRANPEEMWLERVEDFSINFKLYGDTICNTDRILRTFLERPANTGVLLAGEKGSGKTLLAKNVCLAAAREDIPTVLINAPFHGDGFMSFIQSISQPAVVLFDEFEKTYARQDEQHGILTLLDGVYSSKKLFMLTCNDKWRIDIQFRNRPGRIFYLLQFSGLSAEFIREFCGENLEATEYIDQIVSISSTFSAFNFDMLKALCEEMNRYKEDPITALKMLNVKTEFSDPVYFNYRFFHDKQEINRKLIENLEDYVSLNPLLHPAHIYYYTTEQKKKDDESSHVIFAPTDIQAVENNGRTIKYEKGNYRLLLERRPEKIVPAY